MRLIFFGSPDFAVPALRSLVEAGHEIAAVYTQPDRPAGRKRQLRPPPVKTLALDLGLPVRQPERVGAPEIVSEMAAMDVDAGVLAAFGQLLTAQVLAAPKRGIVNVHPSLLPRHRGASPIAGSILSGETETGVSLLLTVRALDAGPLIAQVREPILPDDTTGSLTERLSHVGARLLVETLPRYAAGEIEPRPQDEGMATYDPQIAKEDALIDWTRPARDIWLRVRAFNPWPVAFTRLGSEPLRILAARPLSSATVRSPGAVFVPEKGRLAVCCGADALEILTLQPAGKRALTAAEFLRGQHDPGALAFQ